MALLPISRPCGVFKEVVPVLDTEDSVSVTAPKAGATLTSYYVSNLGVAVLGVRGATPAGDAYTIHLDGAATGDDLHEVVAFFMDAIDTEEFQVNSTFVIKTVGPIISCQCPCECETPIVVNEFILIGTGSDEIIPFKILSAELNPDVDGEWVYTIGASDPTQTLDVNDISCIRCPGESL